MASAYPQNLPPVSLATMAAGYNPREMLEHDYENLKAVLAEFGCLQEIIVNKRTKSKGWKASDKSTIVGGHQRVRAAVEIEMAELPVRWVDLNELQERTLNLALNRITGDFEKDLTERALRFVEELGGDEALAFTGFDEEELADFLASHDGGEGGGGGFNEPGGEHDQECPKCGYRWNG